MHFVCDVHISFKVKDYLIRQGYTAVHLNAILDGDKTADRDIMAFCVENNCILITKDYDFVDSYHLKKIPPKIIKINLGNISNKEIIIRIAELLTLLPDLQNRNTFLIEVDRNNFFISED
jgi:predicted nuclease of predicted toxin-antitoxin system